MPAPRCQRSLAQMPGHSVDLEYPTPRHAASRCPARGLRLIRTQREPHFATRGHRLDAGLQDLLGVTRQVRPDDAFERLIVQQTVAEVVRGRTIVLGQYWAGD